tara:strand:+ start:1095 stop:1490 length:396 start_codon:yes stop_codon:yes gene_type:complete
MKHVTVKFQDIPKIEGLQDGMDIRCSDTQLEKLSTNINISRPSQAQSAVGILQHWWQPSVPTKKDFVIFAIPYINLYPSSPEADYVKNFGDSDCLPRGKCRKIVNLRCWPKSIPKFDGSNPTEIDVEFEVM